MFVSSAMCPQCPRKEEQTKSFRLQSTPTGKRPKVRPRTRWSDYNSDFAWYRLRVESAELFEIRIDRGVFRVLLGELPPRHSKKKKAAWQWVNEWACRPTLNPAICAIRFNLFAKSEFRIQTIKHSLFGRKLAF